MTETPEQRDIRHLVRTSGITIRVGSQRTKFNYVVSHLNQQQSSEVEDIITAPPEHEPYDRLKAELIRRLSTSREQRVRQLFRTKKWVIVNHRNSFAISKASHQTFLMIFSAQCGPAASHLMYRRSLPGRLTAILTRQHNLLTKFAKSPPNQPPQAFHLQPPTTQPGYLNASKSYRANSLLCKQNIHAHALCPESAVAHNLEIVAATPLITQPNPTTYADTTGNSETEPANALPRAPTNNQMHHTSMTHISLQTQGRKTPTADANGCCTSSGHLFITDRVSKRLYLVDSGSDLCVFPRKLLPGRRERIDNDLYAANGTTIPTYGWTSQNLNLGLRRDSTWRFVVADIQTPIIDVDLLSFYGLLVDCRHNRLFDGVTSLSTPGSTAPSFVPSEKVIAGGTPQTPS